eukprot:EG_transcript_89
MFFKNKNLVKSRGMLNIMDPASNLSEEERAALQQQLVQIGVGEDENFDHLPPEYIDQMMEVHLSTGIVALYIDDGSSPSTEMLFSDFSFKFWHRAEGSSMMVATLQSFEVLNKLYFDTLFPCVVKRARSSDGSASEPPLLHLSFETHVDPKADTDYSVVLILRPLAVVLDADWLSACGAFFTNPYHAQLGDTSPGFNSHSARQQLQEALEREQTLLLDCNLQAPTFCLLESTRRLNSAALWVDLGTFCLKSDVEHIRERKKRVQAQGELDDLEDDSYEHYSLRMGNLNAMLTTTTEVAKGRTPNGLKLIEHFDVNVQILRSLIAREDSTPLLKCTGAIKQLKVHLSRGQLLSISRILHAFNQSMYQPAVSPTSPQQRSSFSAAAGPSVVTPARVLGPVPQLPAECLPASQESTISLHGTQLTVQQDGRVRTVLELHRGGLTVVVDPEYPRALGLHLAQGLNPALYLWLQVSDPTLYGPLHDALIRLMHRIGDLPMAKEDAAAADLVLNDNPSQQVSLKVHFQLHCLTVVLHDGHAFTPFASLELHRLTASLTSTEAGDSHFTLGLGAFLGTQYLPDGSTDRFLFTSLLGASPTPPPHSRAGPSPNGPAALSRQDSGELACTDLTHEPNLDYTEFSTDLDDGSPAQRPGAGSPVSALSDASAADDPIRITIATLGPESRKDVESPTSMLCEFSGLHLVLGDGFVEVLEFIWDCLNIFEAYGQTVVVQSIPSTGATIAMENPTTTILVRLRMFQLTWVQDPQLALALCGAATDPSAPLCRFHLGDVALQIAVAPSQDEIQGSVGTAVLYDLLQGPTTPLEVLRCGSKEAPLEFLFKSTAKWVRDTASLNPDGTPPFASELQLWLHCPSVLYIDKHITLLRLHLAKGLVGLRLAGLSDRPLYVGDDSFAPQLIQKAEIEALHIAVEIVSPIVTIPPSIGHQDHILAKGDLVTVNSSLRLDPTTKQLMEQFQVDLQNLQLTAPTVGTGLPPLGDVKALSITLRSPLPDPFKQTELEGQFECLNLRLTEGQYALLMKVVMDNILGWKVPPVPELVLPLKPARPPPPAAVLDRYELEFAGVRLQLVSTAPPDPAQPSSGSADGRAIGSLEVSGVSLSFEEHADHAKQTEASIKCITLVDEGLDATRNHRDILRSSGAEDDAALAIRYATAPGAPDALDVRLCRTQVAVLPVPLLRIKDFLMEGLPKRETPKVEEAPAVNSEMAVSAQFDGVSVLLVEADGTDLAELALAEACVSYAARAAGTTVTGALTSLALRDLLHHATPWTSAVESADASSVSPLLTFAWSSPADGPPMAPQQLKASVRSLRLVVLQSFLDALLSYVTEGPIHLLTAVEAPEPTSKPTPAPAATPPRPLQVDFGLQQAIVIVPEKATSQDHLQLQITHVQVSSQCYPHGEALALEKYTAAITGVGLGSPGRCVGHPQLEWCPLLDDTSLIATADRLVGPVRAAEDSPVPAEVQANVQLYNLRLRLARPQYLLLMRVLRGNLGESPTAPRPKAAPPPAPPPAPGVLPQLHARLSLQSACLVLAPADPDWEEGRPALAVLTIDDVSVDVRKRSVTELALALRLRRVALVDTRPQRPPTDLLRGSLEDNPAWMVLVEAEQRPRLTSLNVMLTEIQLRVLPDWIAATLDFVDVDPAEVPPPKPPPPPSLPSPPAEDDSELVVTAQMPLFTVHVQHPETHETLLGGSLEALAVRYAAGAPGALQLTVSLGSVRVAEQVGKHHHSTDIIRIQPRVEQEPCLSLAYSTAPSETAIQATVGPVRLLYVHALVMELLGLQQHFKLARPRGPAEEPSKPA